MKYTQQDIAFSIAKELESSQELSDYALDVYDIENIKYMVNNDTLSFGNNIENSINVICLEMSEADRTSSYQIFVETIIKRKRPNDGFDFTEVDSIIVDNSIVASDKITLFVAEMAKRYIQDGIIVENDILSGCVIEDTRITRPLAENFDDIYSKISISFNHKKC